MHFELCAQEGCEIRIFLFTSTTLQYANGNLVPVSVLKRAKCYSATFCLISSTKTFTTCSLETWNEHKLKVVKMNGFFLAFQRVPQQIRTYPTIKLNLTFQPKQFYCNVSGSDFRKWEIKSCCCNVSLREEKSKSNTCFAT